MFIMRMAASFLILALAAYGGYTLLQGPNTEIVSSNEEFQNSLTGEIAQLDQYYEGQVGGKFTQVKLLIEDEQIVAEVSEELQLLDAEKRKLINDINDKPNKKELVEALMTTYRMKLEVLENIINLLDENPNETNQSI